MNKNKTLKMIILTITFILITTITTNVFADDNSLLDVNSIIGSTTESTEGADEPIDDITNTLDGNLTTENTTDENNTNPVENTTGETNTVENTTNTNNNTSKYEETDIPYAGPAETILMVTAFIVFAIIGIYTFIKLSQYSNI